MNKNAIIAMCAIGAITLLSIASSNGTEQSKTPKLMAPTPPPTADLPVRPPSGFVQLYNQSIARMFAPSELTALVRSGVLRRSLSENKTRLGNIYICTHGDKAFIVTADHVAKESREPKEIKWCRRLGGTEVAAMLLGKRNAMPQINFDLLFSSKPFEDETSATIFGTGVDLVRQEVVSVFVSGVARLVKDQQKLAAVFATHAPTASMHERLTKTTPNSPLIEMEVSASEYEQLSMLHGSFLWQKGSPTGVFVATHKDASNPDHVKHFALIEPLLPALEEVK